MEFGIVLGMDVGPGEGFIDGVQEGLSAALGMDVGPVEGLTDGIDEVPTPKLVIANRTVCAGTNSDRVPSVTFTIIAVTLPVQTPFKPILAPPNVIPAIESRADADKVVTLAESIPFSELICTVALNALS